MTRRHSIHLARRPEGRPSAADFSSESGPVPDPAEGEVALRTIWLSLDPYMRGRMDAGASYADPVPLGGVMQGQTVGEVMASGHPDFAPGDIATGMTGWTTHGVLPGSELRKLDPGAAPVQTALGVLGMPGLTAWTGIGHILAAKPGETVVVSAATGAVGSVAGQLAKARGIRAIGVAGGAEKCAHATSELGYDACIDHHAQPDGRAMQAALAEAAPDGVDGYFENVGGKTLSGVVPNMNRSGRIAVCGMVAWYSGADLDQALPLPALWRRILVQRLRVEGFIILDHFHRFPDFLSEVAPMVSDGRLSHRESVTDGLDAAPGALIDMLGGGNFGKTLVRVGEDAPG